MPRPKPAILTLRPDTFTHQRFPISTAWLLADCMEFRGKQELWTRHKPEVLRSLREEAMIHSVESSNRIEGVTVSADRLRPLVAGTARPRDRSEHEIAGYRRALAWIFAASPLVKTNRRDIPFDPRAIRNLHKLSQSSEAHDAGEWKTRDNEIIEVTPHGRRVRFVPTSAKQTPAAIASLCDSYAQIATDSLAARPHYPESTRPERQRAGLVARTPPHPLAYARGSLGDRLYPLAYTRGSLGDRLHPLAYARGSLVGKQVALDPIHSPPPLLLIATAIFDFLCIHPFRDGNGRVSRLLTTLLLERHGFLLPRLVSLERLIEESKEDYYHVLGECSIGWVEGKNAIVPWWNYFLGIVRRGYVVLENRVETSTNHSSKTDLARTAILSQAGAFTLRDVAAIIPGASESLLKKVLQDLRGQAKVSITGRGRGARWLVTNRS